jgi:CBS domain-containing protein
MRARDLAETYAIVSPDTPAIEAVRRLATERLPGLVVVDERRRPQAVLPGSQVLRLGVPRYIQDDPALARVVDEAQADVFLRELGDRTVADCRPERPPELPVLNEDDTALEIAALMARTRSPLVAVVDRDGAVIGVVTLHALLDRVLAA